MKKKSALFVSLTMVLVAVLALTTASFAWFTSSLNPTVSNIDIGVTTSDALLISADSTSGFGTSLDASALKVGNNILPDWNGSALTGDNVRRLKTAAPAKGEMPLTSPSAAGSTDEVISFVTGNDSAKWSNTYDQNNYTAVVDNTGLLTGATGDEEKKLYFVKFDLYFKASVILDANDYVQVSLDLTSKAANGTDYDGSSVDPKLPAGAAAYVEKQEEIAKIVRVGFVTLEDNYSTAPAPTAYSRTVWQPDSGSVDGLTGTIAYDTSDDMKYDISASNNGDANRFTGAGNNGAAATTDLELFKIRAGSAHKVTVYIWLEGNDPESDNVLSGGDFSTLLKFVGKAVDVANP